MGARRARAAVAFVREIGVRSEDLRSADDRVEKVVQNLHVHRRSGADADTRMVPVFRRDRRAGHKPMMRRFFHQRVQEKLRRALHDRVGCFQRRLVAGVIVVVPEALTEPGAAGGPHAPERSIDRRGSTPCVRVMVADPAACAVLSLCCALPGDGKLGKHLEERRVTLHEIGRAAGQ